MLCHCSNKLQRCSLSLWQHSFGGQKLWCRCYVALVTSYVAITYCYSDITSKNNRAPPELLVAVPSVMLLAFAWSKAEQGLSDDQRCFILHQSHQGIHGPWSLLLEKTPQKREGMNSVTVRPFNRFPAVLAGGGWRDCRVNPPSTSYPVHGLLNCPGLDGSVGKYLGLQPRCPARQSDWSILLWPHFCQTIQGWTFTRLHTQLLLLIC